MSLNNLSKLVFRSPVDYAFFKYDRFRFGGPLPLNLWINWVWSPFSAFAASIREPIPPSSLAKLASDRRCALSRHMLRRKSRPVWPVCERLIWSSWSSGLWPDYDLRSILAIWVSLSSTMTQAIPTSLRTLQLDNHFTWSEILRWVGQGVSLSERPRIETFDTTFSHRKEVYDGCAFIAENAGSMRSGPCGRWNRNQMYCLG